jgi:hypothetical protein
MSYFDWIWNNNYFYEVTTGYAGISASGRQTHASHNKRKMSANLLLSVKLHGILHTKSIHETTDHSICLYATPWSLASSNHETMDHCLSMQHHGLTNSIHETMDHYLYNTDNHGLFSPIPYMKPDTTLSVYTTPWSPLINSIHETRDHYLYIQHHGLFFTKSIIENWWEETMVLYRQRVIPGLMYETGEKRPWCCIDREWGMVSCI